MGLIMEKRRPYWISTPQKEINVEQPEELESKSLFICIMRKKVLLLTLTSMLMLLCIPVCAQQQSDSTVSLTGLTADMIAKVKAYTPDSGELEEYEYIIEIKPSSDDVNADSKDNKIFQVPEGITIKELLSRLPGVEKDKDGRLITESGKDIVTSIDFNGGMVYPQNTTTDYPDDYKLYSGSIHVVIMDRKHFREYMSKTHKEDLPKKRAEISISHYPRQNADDLLYVILRGRREE